jgi:hypothetical protein
MSKLRVKILEEVLMNENNDESDKFNRSGIYQLTCPDGGKQYIGQTDRLFRKWYNEPLQSFKYLNSNSTFAK